MPDLQCHNTEAIHLIVSILVGIADYLKCAGPSDLPDKKISVWTDRVFKMCDWISCRFETTAGYDVEGCPIALDKWNYHSVMKKLTYTCSQDCVNQILFIFQHAFTHGQPRFKVFISLIDKMLTSYLVLVSTHNVNVIPCTGLYTNRKGLTLLVPITIFFLNVWPNIVLVKLKVCRVWYGKYMSQTLDNQYSIWQMLKTFVSYDVLA